MITDEIQPGAKIFAEIEEQNGTKLKEMQINDRVNYNDKIPDGFFDQPQKDTLKIIKAIRDKNRFYLDIPIATKT